MKALFSAILAGAMCCGLCYAQSREEPQNSGTPSATQTGQAVPRGPANRHPAGNALKIAPGSVIPVQLTKSIDAKKAKTGDAVEAKVTEDMKTGNGMVLVPKDTKVTGHITEAQARNKEQKESQLGIAFDRADVKSMGDVALPMSVQAIIAPTNSNPENGAGYEGGGPAMPQSSGGMSSGNSGGRSAQTAGGMPSQMPASEPSTGNAPNSATSGAAARPPITGNTQGVIGFSNLKLSAAPAGTAGSVVTSEKGNVKLESGTLMLLRVNQ